MREIKLSRGVWQFDEDSPLGKRTGGGFGVVYAGTGPNGAVAVKRLKTSETAKREQMVADDFAGRSFEYVIPILDAGFADGTDEYFVVMAKAEESLQSVIDERGCLDPATAAQILLEIARGLKEVPGLVHRDLKPDNVLRHAGKWKIADFGIARFVEAATSANTLESHGTPQYTAPEQWNRNTLKQTADLYALGCIAHALLTGRPPYTGPDYSRQHRVESVPEMPGIPARLQSLVGQLLRKEPDSRPDVARTIKQLEEFLAAEPNEENEDPLVAVGARLAKQQSDEDARKRQEAEDQKSREAMSAEAQKMLEEIVQRLFSGIEKAAPSARRHPVQNRREATERIDLGAAILQIQRLSKPEAVALLVAEWNIITMGTIDLTTTGTRSHRRSASLLYADAGSGFRWYEVAFFSSRLAPSGSSVGITERDDEPRAIADSRDLKEAFSPGIGSLQIAYGPLPIDDEDYAVFEKRWRKWFALAAEGRLSRPRTLPLPSSEL